jgi:hypothetical protein
VERYYTDADLEALTGIKRQTWRIKRVRGSGPPYVKIGSRVLYDPQETRRWLATFTFNNTTEAAARTGR